MVHIISTLVRTNNYLMLYVYGYHSVACGRKDIINVRPKLKRSVNVGNG